MPELTALEALAQVRALLVQWDREAEALENSARRMTNLSRATLVDSAGRELRQRVESLRQALGGNP